MLYLYTEVSFRDSGGGDCGSSLCSDKGLLKSG
jgi:hypothetical protein